MEIDILKREGLKNCDAIISASAKTGLPLYLAAALIEKESGGANIYGHDQGGVYNIPGKDIEVTPENFKEFVRKISEPGSISNGVGPTQLTWKGFFPDAEKKGLKLWLPLDNMIYGFTVFKSYLNNKYDDASVINAGKRYNGAQIYGEDLLLKSKKWKSLLDGANDEEKKMAKFIINCSPDEARKRVNAWMLANRGITGDEVWRRIKAAGGPGWYGAAWCDATVHLCIYECFGIAVWLLNDNAFYVPNTRNYARARGITKSLPALLSDIYCFNWNPGDNEDDHIGFAYPDPNSSLYRTIEGNTSNSLAVKYRDKYNIETVIDLIGYLRSLGALFVPGAKAIPATPAQAHATTLVVDEILGEQTISKMQAKIGAKVDGKWGPETTKKLQEYLNKKELANLAIDGSYGPLTKKALQKYLGVVQDGIVGSQTIKALQIKLNNGSF